MSKDELVENYPVSKYYYLLKKYYYIEDVKSELHVIYMETIVALSKRSGIRNHGYYLSRCIRNGMYKLCNKQMKEKTYSTYNPVEYIDELTDIVNEPYKYPDESQIDACELLTGVGYTTDDITQEENELLNMLVYYNITDTCGILGVSRQNIYYRLKSIRNKIKQIEGKYNENDN